MVSLLPTGRGALQHAIRASVICTCTLTLLLACGPPRYSHCHGGCQTTDYSARWNETDARKVAAKMISGEMLRGDWLQHWETNLERRPTVMVGPIRDKTTQRIDKEIFIKDIERNLLNSDTVQFAAANEVRQTIRRERQKGVMRPCMGQGDSRLNEMAQENGADFMVLGAVSSTVQDSIAENKAAIYYTVTLELLDLETNAKAWRSEKEIKKIVKRSKVTP